MRLCHTRIQIYLEPSSLIEFKVCNQRVIKQWKYTLKGSDKFQWTFIVFVVRLSNEVVVFGVLMAVITLFESYQRAHALRNPIGMLFMYRNMNY